MLAMPCADTPVMPLMMMPCLCRDSYAAIFAAAILMLRFLLPPPLRHYFDSAAVFRCRRC